MPIDDIAALTETARALGGQSPEQAHRAAAPEALLHRAHCNRDAVQGQYSAATDAP